MQMLNFMYLLQVSTVAIFSLIYTAAASQCISYISDPPLAATVIFVRLSREPHFPARRRQSKNFRAGKALIEPFTALFDCSFDGMYIYIDRYRFPDRQGAYWCRFPDT
jgi:hypothetical protein